MAEEKKLTYQELLAERDAYKAENEVLKKNRVNRQAKNPEEKREAVALTIDLCIQKGYLAKYFEEHRAEVEKIMLTMLSPEYVRMASERTLRIKEAIAFGRDAGLGDDQIKKVIIKRYDLTPTYAQNFLDDDSDPDDSRPEAI